jgi:hypothetical protein
MNHSPMAVPEKGAKTWLAALSAAEAATTTVNYLAPAFSRVPIVRAMEEFFVPTAT